MKAPQPKFWIIAWLGLAAAAASLVVAPAQAQDAGRSQAGDDLYEDLEAGISFSVPLPRPHIKSPGQIKGLIGHDPQAPRWPEHLRLSGGAYSGSGWPYILVWTQDYTGELSKRRADHLAEVTADQLAVTGWQEWRWDPQRLRGLAILKSEAGPRARILVQMGRGRIFYVALYYRQPADARFFSQILRNVKLTAEYQLARSDLPRGALIQGPWLWLGGLLLAAGTGISLLRSRRT